MNVLSELTPVEITPHREEGQVQRGVTHRGVRFKDRHQGQLHEQEKKRMLPGRHFQHATSLSSLTVVA